MLSVITGGSGSGKSAYAENYISDTALKYDNCNKYYIATMKVYDDEGQKKVERHKNLRRGKEFITIEQPNDIERMLVTLEKSYNLSFGFFDTNYFKQDAICKNVALLECMSNLVANEMFTLDENGNSKIVSVQEVCNKVTNGIKVINDYFEDLVIVTNNVFEDGVLYDDSTMRYIEALGIVNQQIAIMADHVIEVVVGLPVVIR